tara:strand:- start:11068 stop:12462 length:1395 start_codon:yes stop_codon:yes gene_type:complete
MLYDRPESCGKGEAWPGEVGRDSNFKYIYIVLQTFKDHLELVFPNLLESPFLLACSGGVDSVVLAHLCAALRLDFSLAHCNFGLRGVESMDDENFVRDLAKIIDKNIFVERFDTAAYISKNKVSLQMAARDLRYAWFHRVMEKNDIPTLVTAHHADDNLESFLINLSRGTGLDGLTGIPHKTDTLCRPLLKFQREDIMDYALKNGITWREDRTNKETKYLRNRIRHQIVPLLKELGPGFMDRFQDTQDHLQQTAGIAGDHIADIRGQLFKKQGDTVFISIDGLGKLFPQKAYLYALFKDYGFFDHREVASLLSAMGGKELRSSSHRLLKHRDHLLLREIREEEEREYRILESDNHIEKPFPLTLKEVDSMDGTGRDILYVDKERLVYPLIVRKWKKGDYFYPFGMRGRKKVGKFFKDTNMDRFSKQDQWLLCSGDEIVWIIGLRPDDRFKIVNTTKKILKINIG